jgi:transposase
VITDDDIRAVYNQGPDAVIALVRNLIQTFELQIAMHEARIKHLESQINTNSGNSGKPPSSDCFVKPKSQRIKSGKKSGAQKGHPGYTLEMTPEPDKILTHKVTICQDCGALLIDQKPDFLERRQVVDIPPLKLEVTEHQAECKTCHACGAHNKAVFPEGVNQPVQYGPMIRSLAVYMNQYQFIPYDRVEEFFNDLFGQPFSEGSLFTANQVCYDFLTGFEQEAKKQILNEPVVNFDETGVRVEGKNHWLHVACTPELTCYHVHNKRGSDGMDDMGILPFYKGIAKRDGLSSYFKYDCAQSLCNDHHLRELTWVIENVKQTWADRMHGLLLDALKAVNDAKDSLKTCLEPEQIAGYLSRYDEIIALGYKENPFFEVWPRPNGKRGRLKRTKQRNLLERLHKY